MKRREAGLCTSCGDRSSRIEGRQEFVNPAARHAARPSGNSTPHGELRVCADGAARRLSRALRFAAPCAALDDGRDREKKNAVRRGRYARLRALMSLHRLRRANRSGGSARCEPCARHSYVSSGEHRGMPLYPPRYTVVELATGEDHGTWDSPGRRLPCASHSPGCRVRKSK